MPLPQRSNAGYADGKFFIRDAHDWFVLLPSARLQIDSYNYVNSLKLPNGATDNDSQDPRPKSTIFVRRARVEMRGTLAKHFDFHIAGEYASIPGAGAYGSVADAFIIIDYSQYIKVQVGQFDAPFMLENRTSDRLIDFMERSLAVRAFGVPQNKEDGLMLFGWLPKKLAYYSAGVFNGEGQSFKSLDRYPAVVGRAFVAPFAAMAGDRQWLQDIWLGGSLWYQYADNLGGSVTPSATGGAQGDLPAMTTQGGIGFFSSSFVNGRDAEGNDVRSHLTMQGQVLKWALELQVPLLNRFGLRAEMVHQSMGLEQYNDTNPTLAKLVRTRAGAGRLAGYGYYVELFAWVLGGWSFIDTPGLETAPRLKSFKVSEPRWGLMLAAKYDHVDFDVSGLPASGDGTTNPAWGTYRIDAFEFGINAWLTKHVRLTANYVLNYVDGDSANVKKNPFYRRFDHEFLFRAGINL